MKSIFFDAALFASLASVLCYLLAGVTGWRKGLTGGGFAGMLVGGLAGVAFLVQEWRSLGRPPFVGTFEVLTALAVLFALAYSAIEAAYRLKAAGPFSSILVLLMLGYASLLEGAPRPLVPALQDSLWLTVHVLLCLAGYAGIFLACVVSLLHLAAIGGPHRTGAAFLLAFVTSVLAVTVASIECTRHGWVDLDMRAHTLVPLVGGTLFFALALLWPASAMLERGARSLARDPSILDEAVFRSIAFAFPLLGLGIVSGAVWAETAWGKYWSWDPKETWSLATWFVYLLYLHLRLGREWKGARCSWVAAVGLFVVAFSFVGVNYLLPGRHGFLG